MPTEDRRFFLALRAGEKGKPARVSICTTADRRVIHTIEGVENMTSGIISTEWGYLRGQPRARFLPTANLLITIPDTNDRLVLRHLDLEKALEESGEDYLYVLSMPDINAVVGKSYEYQMEVISNAGGVKYKLESGPQGMTLSKDGKLSWRVNSRAIGGQEKVIIAVSNKKGQEAFHAIDLYVVRQSISLAGRDRRPPPISTRPRKPSTPDTDDTAEQPAPDPVEVPLEPPTDIPAELAIQLPERYDTYCTARGGRYLIFQIKSAKRLMVFDVVSAKLLKEISISADDAVFTAGLDYLMVVLPGQKLIQRWRLDTFERDKVAPVPADLNVGKVRMGYASRGPLLLWSKDKGQLFDVEEMEPIIHEGEFLRGDSKWGLHITQSADGQTYLGWVDTGSGGTHTMMRINGNRTTITKGSGGIYGSYEVQPNADGSFMYANNGGVLDANLKRVSAESLKGYRITPTNDPRFFVAFRGKGGSAAEVCIGTAADRQIIHTIKGLDEMPVPREGTSLGGIVEPRVRFIPASKLLLTLPPSNDQVVLRRLDLLEELKRSGQDFLMVLSVPPARAEVGRPFMYKLQVASKAGKVKYRLESGPDGMTLSNKGELRWNVKTRPVGGKVPVLVSVSDGSGQEVFHSFELSVERPAVVAAGGGGSTLRPAPSRPRPRESAETESPATPPAAEPTTPPVPLAGADDVVKIDEHRLELPKGAFQLAPGWGGRCLLLLSGDRLTILAPDGFTIQRQVQLRKSYVRIRERREYFVAIGTEPPAIDLIDKRKLSVIRSFRLSTSRLTDLALHPTKPFCYVAFKAGIEPPRYRFIMYNEETGEGRESEDLIGKWLRVVPSGKILVAGYSDIYERGSRLLFNPGRIHVVPEYGSIDWLMTYDLDRNGMPEPREVKEKAGGNGKGIRMSPDGRRATYLSHVGYPKFSGNLGGWDPADLGKIPVTYPLKDQGTTGDLAYHPSLPMVASPGSGSAVFRHRDTGEDLGKKLKDNADELLAGTQVHRIYFSPDGANAIFDTSVNEIHYLVKLELNLTPDEMQKVRAAGRRLSTLEPPADAPAERVAAAVPLTELHALEGGAGKAMTVKDVARWFTDSVVLIRGDDASGSGFVVGSKGYILTCAHCVLDQGELTGAYRVVSGGETKMVETPVDVLHADEQRDLALVKIDAPVPLRSVRLAATGTVASGERVTVIGNPGVGRTILDHTVTEGIVSSPNRQLGGQTFIQTSAAINPGSSGGPMFNDHGLVVGLVVLKAQIEGAGFAVPAADLIGFLVDTASREGDAGKIERYWTDSTGKSQVKAQYLGFADGKVGLKTGEGKTFALPLSRLSKGDQEFVRLMNRRGGE